MSRDQDNPTLLIHGIPFINWLDSETSHYYKIKMTHTGKVSFKFKDRTYGTHINYDLFVSGKDLFEMAIGGHKEVVCNVTEGEWINIQMINESSLFGEYELVCLCENEQPTLPPMTPTTDINEDKDIIFELRYGEIKWFKVVFKENGKANFFLDVYGNHYPPDPKLEVYIGSKTGPLLGASNHDDYQQSDLISQKPVIAGQEYYIKIYNSRNYYTFRCKNYTTDNNYSHLLKKTASYKGNGGSKNLSTFEDERLTKQIGSISNGEIVTVKSIINEVALITYSTSNGNKDAYIPLSHLDGKEYIELYIKQMKARYTPKIVNGWYTYDGWIVNQEFNDLTSRDKYLGHLGIDIKNIIKPVARAVYPGKVHYAGISYSRGRRSANGYVVQIEHTYGGKTFYSFYAHLRPDSINVKKDDQIEAGDIIGIMGHTTSVNTGNGMGDHIHLGIYTGTASPQGAEYGYNRVLNSKGKQTFYAPNGYYTYKDDTFYKPNLWHKILKLL